MSMRSNWAFRSFYKHQRTVSTFYYLTKFKYRRILEKTIRIIKKQYNNQQRIPLQINIRIFGEIIIHDIWSRIIIITIPIKQKMIKSCQPLKQLFDDINYAWELLEYQIKLQTSDQINGQDISHLLQLYMRGVEKMNSLVDIRQSFFKSRVTSLMSRSNVIKTLNKPMGKKNKQAPIVQSTPVIKIQPKVELQLKQKRKEIEMRMAYGAQQHNPDALKKMIVEHHQKQSFISDKINKLVDSHEQRLMNRIKQRKLRTLTAKSRSEVYNHDTNDTNGNYHEKKQIMEKNRDEEQFGTILSKKQKLLLKKSKTVSPKRQKFDPQYQSPMKRRVSVDFSRMENMKKIQ